MNLPDPESPVTEDLVGKTILATRTVEVYIDVTQEELDVALRDDMSYGEFIDWLADGDWDEVDYFIQVKE